MEILKGIIKPGFWYFVHSLFIQRPRLPTSPSNLWCLCSFARAAFALEVLKGTIKPGVWYPAELDPEARAAILDVVKEGAIVWEV